MALEVEDGTGKANAESYISVADADAWLAARGYTLWATLSETEKEQALRRATDAMVQFYRQRWKGTRTTGTQALDWPRAWVLQEDYYATNLTPPSSIDGNFYYPSDEVPAIVTHACALLAFKAAAGDLVADLGRQTVREKVGEIEVQYEPGSRQSTKYRAIDLMLKPLLKGDGSTLQVVRA